MSQHSPVPERQKPVDGERIVPAAEQERLERLSHSAKTLHQAAQGILNRAQEEHPKEGRSYVDEAKAHYSAMNNSVLALLDAGKHEEMDALLPALRAHLLQAETEGREELKDLLHMQLSRNTDGRFLHIVYDSLRQELPTLEEGSAQWRLAVKAAEFRASRLRREGFGRPNPEWEPDPKKVEEAKKTLEEVLRLWRGVGDTVSQSRVLYELGYIASEEGNWRTSAAWQVESRIVAEQAGNIVGALIAQVSEVLALSNAAQEEGNGASLPRLLERMTGMHAELAAYTRKTPSDQNAANWRKNALYHCANIAGMAGRWQECRLAFAQFKQDPYFLEHQTQPWAKDSVAKIEQMLTQAPVERSAE